MKKRRELDALVNGKSSSGRRKKNGQHELLRNESESSDDIEEFSMPQKGLRKQSTWRLCSTCLSLCGLFLLTTCVVGVAGLVWVHVELKKDVDDLRAQIHKAVTDSQTSQNELVGVPDIQRQLQKAMASLQANITDVNVQLNTLSATTQSLENLMPNYQPYQLPDTVQNLPETVADIGSHISTLEGMLNTLNDFKVKTEQDLSSIREHYNGLQNRGDNGQVSSRESDFVSVGQDLQDLHDAVELLGVSVTQNISTITQHSHMHTVAIRALQNVTSDLSNRVSLLELQPATQTASSAALQDTIHDSIAQAVSELMNATTNGDVTQEDIAHLQEQIDACAVNVQKIQQQIVELQKDDENTPSTEEMHYAINVYQNDTMDIINSLNFTLSTLRERVMDKTDTETASAVVTPSTVTEHRLAENATPQNVVASIATQTATEETIVRKSTDSVEDEPLDDASLLDTTPATVAGVDKNIPTWTDGQQDYLYDDDISSERVYIPGIESREDLAVAFRRWDGNLDHKISSDEIGTVLGMDVLNALIAARADEDDDGYFSEEELQAVLL